MKAQTLLKASAPLPKPDPADAKPAGKAKDGQPASESEKAKAMETDVTANEVAQETQEEATQNKHIVDLRKTIQHFEKRVKKTLDDTEQKIKHNTAAIEVEHDKLETDSKTLSQIENLGQQAKKMEKKLSTPTMLLQLGEMNPTVQVTAPKEDLEALLAKKKAALISNLEKLQKDVQQKNEEASEKGIRAQRSWQIRRRLLLIRPRRQL